MLEEKEEDLERGVPSAVMPRAHFVRGPSGKYLTVLPAAREALVDVLWMGGARLDGEGK